MGMGRLLLFFHLLLAITVTTGAVADEPSTTEQQAATGVVEKTGDFLPLDAVFKDGEGKDTTLRAIIDKPTLLLPVYYTCPQICSFDMANLALAMQQTSIPYDSFNIITLSFNEKEAPRHAAAAKNSYTAMLADDFPTDNWHFLVGEKENIHMVTEAIGYTFRAADDGLFLHPSALVATGSDGKIIKYVYGSFLSGDVDLALSEAAKGTPATSIKRFLAYCLSGEVKQNKTVFLILKSSVIFFVIIGGILLVRLLRQDK